LLSEIPIDAVWSRLGRLKSATLSRKAVTNRADVAGRSLGADAAISKGDGVAYAVRNAADYFAFDGRAGNLSQRVLNLYYGSLSFVLAEILSAPGGPSRLEEVEGITKQGHGFWNLDPDGAFINFAIGPLDSGLFPAWIKSLGTGQPLTAEKRPRKPEDLTNTLPNSWVTMEQLFARIPEIGDLFEDVFPGRPAWVTAVYDVNANRHSPLFGGERPKTSYILLVDDTGRMTTADVAALPGPLREIQPMTNKTRAHHFRAAVDHPDSEHWWGALSLHNSSFERNALIMPIFGSVGHYRATCLSALYALSIVVRYRPSLWRRIQEGDLDHIRALIEAFLSVAERILPEQFHESITGECLSIHQPGSFFS
jgi:hypothetical protein